MEDKFTFDVEEIRKDFEMLLGKAAEVELDIKPKYTTQEEFDKDFFSGEPLDL